MRIVIDLQGAQSVSRHRGIGRYSLALAKAMVRRPGHDYLIALNGLIPETINPIRAAFAGLLPQENIRVWRAPGPVQAFGPANDWRRSAAELVREAFLRSLEPDILHISSLFEGFGDEAVHSVGRYAPEMPTAATFYDLIPLIQRDVYLTPHPSFEPLYMEKIGHLKRADLLLAISESSRQEPIKYLGMRSDQVVNIGAASDEGFKPIQMSEVEAAQLKAKYGVNRRFILNSGAADERKNHIGLIDAYKTLPVEIKKDYQLVFVGGMPPEYMEKFKKYVASTGQTPNDVVLTGRVTDRELVMFYNLCDLYVFPSQHEGFGLPALEALACGAAVIGSDNTSVPEVIGLPDALFNPHSPASIAAKIAQALTDRPFYDALKRRGPEQARKFSWDISAGRAICAFESWRASSDRPSLRGAPQPPERSLPRAIAHIPGKPEGAEAALALAQAIARLEGASCGRQLLVDVSELAVRDSRTGVQRVVRSILKELLENPPTGFNVEPVRAELGKNGYRYATGLKRKFLPDAAAEAPDALIDYAAGDVFFALDMQHATQIEQSPFLQEMRLAGVKVVFLLYDLLPVTHPDEFRITTYDLHKRLLLCMADVDGVVCISRSVALELRDWLADYAPSRVRPLEITWAHIGADIDKSAPTLGLPANAAAMLAELHARPTFLTVGTIEPRKRHKQILAACERLWAAGRDINWVIVGQQGWHVEELVERMKAHPQFGFRLFWLNDASDEYLERIYAASTCLIFASAGEGFGLPLIEAARHHLPIIVRDLPVFREVAGTNAFYFSGKRGKDLADAIQRWLDLHAARAHPRPDGIGWLTWRQSARQMIANVLGGPDAQEIAALGADDV